MLVDLQDVALLPAVLQVDLPVALHQVRRLIHYVVIKS